jgi:hypothetical protein
LDHPVASERKYVLLMLKKPYTEWKISKRYRGQMELLPLAKARKKMSNKINTYFGSIYPKANKYL